MKGRVCPRLRTLPRPKEVRKIRNNNIMINELVNNILVTGHKCPKMGGIIRMGAQTRTDVLPYISLIPVFGYLCPDK